MAQDTLQVTSVRIQNFRSIVDAEFDLSRLNLFVGLNDAGKSNVLRSLDLFFNGPRQFLPGQFEREFCHYAKVPANKAKEIRINITLKIPSSYSATDEVVWKKVWRSAGIHEVGAQRSLRDGADFVSRSRIPALLDAIRYEYVPAIKGPEYFERLLGSLHDVLLDTVEREIRAASGGFTSTINASTSAALLAIEKRLGIKSSIELPADLRELFSRLDFRSQKGSFPVSLGQRGDGVKIRHIPILLNFLAQQANTQRIAGRVPIHTIWGFEEPENNLEMSRAVELAREFVEYSKNIQIFATTHSPAFYSLGQENTDAKVFLVADCGPSGETEITAVQAGGFEGVDEHIGLLPFVAPSFARAVAERDSALENLAEVKRLNRHTVFVEGKTDEVVLRKAFELFSPGLLEKTALRSENGAGANWVKDMLIAWAHGRVQYKALGICDLDLAGTTAKREVHENSRVKTANHTSQLNGTKQQIAVIQLDKTPSLIPIFKKGLKLPVALEELFPIEVWRHADSKGWLEERGEIVRLNEFTALGTTFEDYCRAKDITEDELFLLVKCVSMESKEKFAKYVVNLTSNELAAAFSSFSPLVKKIGDFFEAAA